MFKACIKKEIFEELRTKRFLRLSLLATAMTVLTAMIIGIMSLVSKLDITVAGQEADTITAIMQMFQPNYATFAMYFGAFMMTYFTIICIVMNMSVISKEIAQNKWILPISAGILPETMISAKLIVKTISVIVAEMVGIILHFLIAIICFEPINDFGIGSLLLTYLAIIVFSMFMIVLTICINAISKKSWLSAALPIILLIVGSTTLESILVGSTPMIVYTPFVFYELAINPGVAVGAVQWLSAIVSMAIVLVGMVVWAILSSRVKPGQREDF